MWMDIAQEGDQEPRSDEEDTVYDRSNPFHSKRAGNGDAELELRNMIDEPETRCGIGSWRPIYLQKFANRSVFSVIFTVVAVIQGSFWSYYTANISTYEKRFRMDSVTSGILLCTNELAQFLIAIIFTYVGFRRHRAKLLTLGVVLSSISCFLMASPHYFLGPGQTAIELMAPKVVPTKAALFMELNAENASLEATLVAGITKSTLEGSSFDGSPVDEMSNANALMTSRASGDQKNSSASTSSQRDSATEEMAETKAIILDTTASSTILIVKDETSSSSTQTLDVSTNAQEMIPLINGMYCF